MYLAVGITSQTMLISAASIPRRHAAMNAGCSVLGWRILEGQAMDQNDDEEKDEDM